MVLAAVAVVSCLPWGSPRSARDFVRFGDRRAGDGRAHRGALRRALTEKKDFFFFK